MNKRQVRTTDGLFYWIFDMPEIEPELKELLAEAGQIMFTGSDWRGAELIVKFNSPLRVRDWRIYSVRDQGDYGLAINSDTNAIIGSKPRACVKSLPQEGDKTAALILSLALHSFHPDEELTLEDMRVRLREFAHNMTMIWVYHFK